MEANLQHMLKSHGLSLTAVRMAVLDVLHDTPHSEASHIFEQVRAKVQAASLQAVYNNLNTLVEHGIVREIKPKGRPSLYETRIGDNHHHLVCRKCEMIMDVDCKDVAPCLTPKHDHGFVIDEAEVIFWGLCPNCK